MGLGPVPAVKNLLFVTGCRLNDMDMIEVGNRIKIWRRKPQFAWYMVTANYRFEH